MLFKRIITLCVIFCLGGCSGEESQPHTRNDASLTDAADTQQSSGTSCLGPQNNRLEQGETSCIKHCIHDCVDGQLLETPELCEGTDFSDVEIGSVELGWQTDTTHGDPVVSGNFEVTNAGEVITENVTCHVELVTETGEPIEEFDVLSYGEQPAPGQTIRQSFSSGGQESDAYPTAIITCTADNEPCTFVDEANRHEEEARERLY